MEECGVSATITTFSSPRDNQHETQTLNSFLEIGERVGGFSGAAADVTQNGGST